MVYFFYSAEQHTHDLTTDQANKSIVLHLTALYSVIYNNH